MSTSNNTKQLNTRICNKIDTADNWKSAGNFFPAEGEMLVYSDVPSIKFGNGYDDIPLINLRFISCARFSEPATITEVDFPTATNTKYTGSVVSGNFTYNTNAMIISGTTKAANKGTYTAIFTLRRGYKWKQAESERFNYPYVLTWTIS